MLRAVERWAVTLVGCAATLYIVRCAPILLAPLGVLTALLHLLLGILLTIASAGALVVAAWYVLSEPVKAQPVSKAAAAAAGAASAPADGSGQDAVPDTQQAQQEQTTYAQLVEDMIPMGGGRDGPPPALSRQGEFSDWVYTMPTAKYDRNEALANWPPETEGEKAIATKWFALAKGGELFLAPNPATSNNKFVPMVTVPLAGCQIHVPTEGLRGKSKWWKKCPLEISHPDKPLLSQQTSFFMFASDGFAKTQWYGVLLWGAQGGGVPRTVEGMFDAFSASVRMASTIPHLLPQASHEDEAAPAKRRGRWGLFKASFRRTGRSSSSKGKKGERPVATVDPDDVDALWCRPKSTAALHHSQSAAIAGHIQSDPGPSPAASHDDGGHGKSKLSRPASAVPERRPGSAFGGVSDAEDSAAERTASGSSAGLALSSDDEGPPRSSRNGSFHGQPPGGSAHGSGDSSSHGPKASAHSASPLSGAGQRLPPRPPASGKQPQGPAPSRSMPACVADGHADAAGASPPPKAQPASPASAKANGKAAERPDKLANQAPEDTWAGEREPVEAAANMLITRVAFDLLRAPSFRDAAAAYIQRKLDQLRYPAYIGPLKVVDICVGRSVPEVDNFRALPTPSGAIWPQFLLDISYRGDAWVMVETKIDVRSSTAWSQFDEAIGHFGGESPAAHAEPAVATDDDLSEDDVPPVLDAPADRHGRARRKLLDVGAMRKAAASQIRRIADSAAKSISQIPLRLKVRISSIDGTMLAWLPPPPGDRLWTAFTSLRELNLTAKPVVGSRMLKSTAQAARASQWIENKLKRSIEKNMMYPACSDMRLPGLIPYDSPDVARPLPKAKPEAGEEVEALLATGQAGAHILAALAGDRASRQPPTNLAALRATAEVLASQGSSELSPGATSDRPDSSAAGISPSAPKARQQSGDAFHSVVQAAQKRASEPGYPAAAAADRHPGGTAPAQPPDSAATGDPTLQQPALGSSPVRNKSGGGGSSQLLGRRSPVAATASGRAGPAAAARAAEADSMQSEPQEVELQVLPRRSDEAARPQRQSSGSGDIGSAAQPAAQATSADASAAADATQQAPSLAGTRQRSNSLPYPHADAGGATAERPRLRVSVSDAGDGSVHPAGSSPRPSGASPAAPGSARAELGHILAPAHSPAEEQRQQLRASSAGGGPGFGGGGGGAAGGFGSGGAASSASARGGQQQGKPRWFASSSISDRVQGRLQEQSQWLADATRGLTKNLSKAQPGGGRDTANRE